MIRAIGAALLMLGSLGLGVRGYLTSGARAREIADYGAMLELLRCEIELRLAPIEQALETAGRMGAADRFVEAVLSGVRRRGGAYVGDAWSEALPIAPREIRPALSKLAPVLGRYDGEEQGRALEDARRMVEQQRSAADSEHRRNGRLYITFGICGGVAATVLLL